MSIPQIKFTTQAALASKWRDACYFMASSNLYREHPESKIVRGVAERHLNEFFSAVEKAMEDGE